jgi:hypothetical protein
MTEALVAMLNSYFHDLAVAFLWASSLMAHLVLRSWPGTPPPRLTRSLSRMAWGSLAWVLIGGAVRAWFFREYEWLPKAGTAQIPVLIVKHVLLVALTLWGLQRVLRLRSAVPEASMKRTHR